MSQSPVTAAQGTVLKDYFQSWDALAAMIRRGQSFSGRERNCAFLNIGDERWADVAAVTGLDLIDDGRAVALSDWDHDGDLDLWIANRTGPRIRFMRNNMQTQHHSLQFRLVGNMKNLDVIGARVEVQLRDGRPLLVQSLRAGGGFVSQSSKWIHFGLGAEPEIQHVVVRWPDGFREVLAGIQADRRYTIIKGPSSSPSTVEHQPRNSRHINLASSTPKIPSDTEHARVVLTRRRTLPDLEYESMQGERVKLDAVHGKPMLINLWASWCDKCIAELSDLSAHEAALRERELSVVALCADELTTTRVADRSTTEQSLMNRLGFPFAIGHALPETLKELSLLQSQALYRERLPLPTSFLVDRQGRVAVIYKGRVTMDQLLSDLQLIEQPPDDLAVAFPFPGRNGIDLFPMTAVDIAQAYEEGGYFDDAEQELVRYLVKTRRALSAKTLKPTAETKESLERAYHSLAMMLGRRGRAQESVAVLEQAVNLFPNSEKLRAELTKLRGGGHSFGEKTPGHLRRTRE